MQERVIEMAKSSPEATDGDRQRTAIRKAIILAAGSGRRMRPFTDTLPKCLVPVNGMPILINALTHLCDVGIRETVVIVGHHKEKVYELVGDAFRDMRIIYVEAMEYASTNNMYSLWMAREHLCEDILLLEADVFFDRQLIEKMLSREGGNLAAVARHQPWMSGIAPAHTPQGSAMLARSKNNGPVRPSSQDERSHVGQRSPGIASSTRSLVRCYSLKKAF